MAGFFERVKRRFDLMRSAIPLPIREGISSIFGHLKMNLAGRAGFMIFYLVLGVVLTLITQAESLSEFGNKVLDEQIGIRTIMLMLAGSAILASITYSFYRSEGPQNKTFLRLRDALSRVVSTGADLCLIFISITAIPVMFSSDHPSLLSVLLGYVSLLVVFGVMTYIPTFVLNTRKSMRCGPFVFLSAAVIVLVSVVLYAAASYK